MIPVQSETLQMCFKLNNIQTKLFSSEHNNFNLNVKSIHSQLEELEEDIVKEKSEMRIKTHYWTNKQLKRLIKPGLFNLSFDEDFKKCTIHINRKCMTLDKELLYLVHSTSVKSFQQLVEWCHSAYLYNSVSMKLKFNDIKVLYIKGQSEYVSSYLNLLKSITKHHYFEKVTVESFIISLGTDFNVILDACSNVTELNFESWLFTGAEIKIDPAISCHSLSKIHMEHPKFWVKSMKEFSDLFKNSILPECISTLTIQDLLELWEVDLHS